jgi:hypothetical protein
METYDLFLPVFKQGDDFQHHVTENNGDPIASFKALAEQYKSAAEICELIANTFTKSKSLKNVEVSGCTHCIWITANEKIVTSLLKEGILSKQECYEED